MNSRGVTAVSRLSHSHQMVKRLATGSDDKTVRIWDIAKRNVIKVFEDGTFQANEGAANILPQLLTQDQSIETSYDSRNG